MIRQLINAALLTLCVLLLTVAGHAQSPQLAPPIVAAPRTFSIVLPPDEINASVRAAGFSPQAPPRREGMVYVLQAIDQRDVLMRLVVDAGSGAIRAVDRVVAPRPDSVISKTLPSHRASPNEPPLAPAPFGPPVRDGSPDQAMPVGTGSPPSNSKAAELSTPPTTPSDTVLGTHSILPLAPPLPRARPSNLKHTAKPNGKVPNVPSIKSIFAPAAASTAPMAPRSSSAAPRSAPASPHPRPAARPGPATPNSVPQIPTPELFGGAEHPERGKIASPS